MGELSYYNAAKQALAQAVSIDDVKDIRDKAEAIRLYAKQQRDDEMEQYAAQIKTRAMRRMGELSAELETQERVRTDLRPTTGTQTKRHILEEAGISKSTAHRCEKLAGMPEEKFEEAVKRGETSTEILKSLNVHVSNNSGENEWYTPQEFIEAVREVMGTIDLDPASSEIANRTVLATKFYSIEDDGLSQKWKGKIFCNPPYSQPEIGLFSAKFVEEIDAIDEAIILVNNATETKWFQSLLSICSAICLPRSRIRFLDPEGNLGAPLQGQAFIYIGENMDDFKRVFEKFGAVLHAI